MSCISVLELVIAQLSGGGGGEGDPPALNTLRGIALPSSLTEANQLPISEEVLGVLWLVALQAWLGFLFVWS